MKALEEPSSRYAVRHSAARFFLTSTGTMNIALTRRLMAERLTKSILERARPIENRESSLVFVGRVLHRAPNPRLSWPASRAIDSRSQSTLIKVAGACQLRPSAAPRKHRIASSNPCCRDGMRGAPHRRHLPRPNCQRTVSIISSGCDFHRIPTLQSLSHSSC